MKRNHKILISIGIVLLVVATAGVVFQVDKTLVANKQQQLQIAKEESDKDKEQKYRDVIMAISFKVHKSPTSVDKFPESVGILESLNGYLFSAYLIDYVNALEEIDKPKPNYSLIVDSLNKIPKDYKGDLSTEIKNFKDDYLDKAELRKYVSDKGYSVETLSEYKGFKINDIDMNIIPSFEKSNIQYNYLNDDSESGLLSIPSDKVILVFNRAYVESIIQIKDSGGNIVDASAMLVDLAKQRSIEYKEASDEMTKAMEANSAREAVKKTLRIGMTAAEVLETSWGKPQSVNRTTTASGVSEQWVYSSGKYVYIDNGIVTAIQE